MKRSAGPRPNVAGKAERVRIRAATILEAAYAALIAKRYDKVSVLLTQILTAVPPPHPAYATALVIAAMLAVDKSDIEQAYAWVDRALEMTEGIEWPAAHSFLALILTRRGQFTEAVAAAHRSIALKPTAEGYNNLGNALYGAGRYDEALAAYDAGGQLRKGMASLRFNRSLVYLTRGDYAVGFEQYEARWNILEWERDHGRPFHKTHPKWWGRDLTGQTILLHGEQGHGDLIQQLRYLPWVWSKGPQLMVLEVHHPLMRLVKERAPMIGRALVVGLGESLPRFDCWCPMMSLCGLHGTTVETIPPSPYLTREV